MRERGYRVEGIIIKRINCGEADKILTIFTLQRGKICCLAKGIRKICSRRAPACELFNKISAYIIKGRTLDLVAEVKTLTQFSNLSKKLRFVSSAYYLVELVERLTAENQENWLIYSLLSKALEKVNQGEGFSEEDFVRFQKELLVNLGFGLPYKISKATLDNHIETILDRKINSNGFINLWASFRT